MREEAKLALRRGSQVRGDIGEMLGRYRGDEGGYRGDIEEAKLALRRGSQALLELRQKFARSAAAKGAAAAARLDGAKARLGARTLALTLTLTLTLTMTLTLTLPDPNPNPDLNPPRHGWAPSTSSASVPRRRSGPSRSGCPISPTLPLTLHL